MYFDNVLEYESLKKIISEIDEYRNEVLGLTSENFIEELNDIVKENEKRKETFIEELSSDHFNLEIKNTNNKNVFKVKLNNNIKFNKIYSDYSINKVYNEGLGDIYTYSSTSILDIYNRVDKFISCLEDKDSTSLFKLLDEILNEPLEV